MEVQKKLLANTKKALKEHSSTAFFAFHSPYVSSRAIRLPKIKHPLQFLESIEERQGKRSSMEDASFILETDYSLFLGVFDGHGGSMVSSYAARRLSEIFSDYQGPCPKNIEEILKHSFLVVQQEIENLHSNWATTGSTAVVSWIDKKENLLYTATLGDSTANIYRLIKDKWQSIPLSCIRNWSSKRDRASAKRALGEEIPFKDTPKEMRHPLPGFSVYSGCGLNVSRALGDVAYKGVIHIPKITLIGIVPGDIIILACDGLKDFVAEEEIIEQIGFCKSFRNIAKQLATYAIEEGCSSDNVSIIALQCKLC